MAKMVKGFVEMHVQNKCNKHILDARTHKRRLLHQFKDTLNVVSNNNKNTADIKIFTETCSIKCRVLCVFYSSPCVSLVW